MPGSIQTAPVHTTNTAAAHPQQNSHSQASQSPALIHGGPSTQPDNQSQQLSQNQSALQQKVQELSLNQPPLQAPTVQPGVTTQPLQPQLVSIPSPPENATVTSNGVNVSLAPTTPGLQAIPGTLPGLMHPMQMQTLPGQTVPTLLSSGIPPNALAGYASHAGYSLIGQPGGQIAGIQPGLPPTVAGLPGAPSIYDSLGAGPYVTQQGQVILGSQSLMTYPPSAGMAAISGGPISMPGYPNGILSSGVPAGSPYTTVQRSLTGAPIFPGATHLPQVVDPQRPQHLAPTIVQQPQQQLSIPTMPAHPQAMPPGDYSRMPTANLVQGGPALYQARMAAPSPRHHALVPGHNQPLLSHHAVPVQYHVDMNSNSARRFQKPRFNQRNDQRHLNNSRSANPGQPLESNGSFQPKNATQNGQAATANPTKGQNHSTSSS